ncbi:ABC transporter ATP-binding protein [candidate division WOR-3 bacterium]|nr:ABC transporter ATP-binding protein [candidate division WOR-3 bacterium]
MNSIEVINLKKKYKLRSARKARYDTLRDTIVEKVKLLGSIAIKNRSFSIEKSTDFWALKGVSFEVKQGERIGLIGANGAGKTTILKILSRITIPTQGFAVLRGRVASLLEVGTGFHPELTGRENIFMNGSILGMKRSEIKKQFSQIVEFSGVDQFIDMPVKRYSSGMFVRLAFSVAAHLESEILLVDEVLAVGDIQFQEKCINKMKDITEKQDRTIVFVTHNMAALKRFCQRALYLEKGEIVFDGQVEKAIENYLALGDSITGKIKWPDHARPGNNDIKISKMEIINQDLKPEKSIYISHKYYLKITYEVITDNVKPQFSVVLSDKEGTCLFGSINNTDKEFYGKKVLKGNYVTMCEFYANLLNAGTYLLSLIGFSGNFTEQFRIDNALSVEMLDDGILKGDYPGNYGGLFRPKLIWKTEKIDA